MIFVDEKEFIKNSKKYLKIAERREDIYVLRNGEAIAILLSTKREKESIVDSLVGVLKEDYDDKKTRLEKYENLD